MYKKIIIKSVFKRFWLYATIFIDSFIINKRNVVPIFSKRPCHKRSENTFPDCLEREAQHVCSRKTLNNNLKCQSLFIHISKTNLLPLKRCFEFVVLCRNLTKIFFYTRYTPSHIFPWIKKMLNCFVRTYALAAMTDDGNPKILTMISAGSVKLW